MVDEVKLEQRLTAVEQRSKSNEHRIDELKDRQDKLDELVTAVSTLASEQKYQGQTIDRIDKKLNDIADKPAKRWEGLITTVISVIVGALIGLALASAGIG